MRSKFKKLICIVIVFFLFDILDIKAHNASNGGCEEHCFNIINRNSNGSKTKVFNKNKKIIIEKNSCVNDSLCRGW